MLLENTMPARQFYKSCFDEAKEMHAERQTAPAAADTVEGVVQGGG